MFEKTNQTDEAATREKLRGFPKFEGETIPVKYNGERKDIPISEAITLAQKGMNYDKMLARQARESEAIGRLAERAGLSREEYLAMLERGEDAKDASWRQLLREYPDAEVNDDFHRRVDAGEQPYGLYQKQLIESLREQLGEKSKSAENRRRAIGPAHGDAEEEVRDAFLEGFYGV